MNNVDDGDGSNPGNCIASSYVNGGPFVVMVVKWLVYFFADKRHQLITYYLTLSANRLVYFKHKIG